MTELQEQGFAIVSGVLDDSQAQVLQTALARAGHGMRDLLARVPEVRGLIPALQPLVGPVLGPTFTAIRGIFFDKTPQANWKVAWHQDVTIAVKGRLDVPGFRAWSIKAGVPHVQPPAEILNQILTVRISLDECGPDNGPLRVIPGTHTLGRLPKPEVLRLAHQGPEHVCCVPRGGALLMRPLLIHASSPARQPEHRRVVHIELTAASLPGGLEWAGA